LKFQTKQLFGSLLLAVKLTDATFEKMSVSIRLERLQFELPSIPPCNYLRFISLFAILIWASFKRPASTQTESTKAMGENQKVVWAEFSTLSGAVLLL
jgi:hypothetical protein